MAKTKAAASPENAAKAEKKAAEAAAKTPAVKAPKEKKAAKITVIRFLRDPSEKEKVGGQAGLILQKVKDCGEAGINRRALINGLDEKTLATRQPVERVVSFYQKKLMDMGIISVTKEDGEPAAAE